MDSRERMKKGKCNMDKKFFHFFMHFIKIYC